MRKLFIAFCLLLAASPAYSLIPDGTPFFRWTQGNPVGGTVAQFKLFCQASTAPAPSVPFKTFNGTVFAYQSVLGELTGTQTCWIDVVGADGGYAGSNRVTITVPVKQLVWPRPALDITYEIPDEYLTPPSSTDVASDASKLKVQ